MAGLEGSTLDRYELRKLVGKGGMAEVYFAFDRKFQRDVAVKVFKRNDEEMLRRFIREAQLMASLRHAHLLPVYDAGEYVLDGYAQYYIVMPFVDGGTLRNRIKQHPLTPVEACRYLSDIADALDYVHSKGIIHRDIKASNVLLTKEGICYLADFGIARASGDSTQLTSTGNVLGTVDYVAPELFEVNRKADALSDLYSLGVLLFEMVTGQLPFAAENQIALVSMHMHQPPPAPSKYSPIISPPIERVIYRALAKRPEQRYQSATELANAFCQAATAPADAFSAPARPASGNMWEYSPASPSLADSGQRGPLILPAPVASAPLPPPARSIPSTPVPPIMPTQAYAPSGRPPVAYQQPGMYPTQPGKRPPTVQERGRRQRTIVLSVLALLVLASAIAFGAYAVNHPQIQPGSISQTQTAGATTTGSTATTGITVTPNATTTAQANAAASATASANQTAVAIANTTATANAQASATPGVFGTAIASPQGNAYNDGLKKQGDDGATWDINDNCSFQSDGYHVKAGHTFGVGGQFTTCHETGKQFNSVAVSVDMNILNGSSGGVLFRVDTGSSCCNGYMFEVDSQGRYKLSINRTSGTTTLQDWTSSVAIKQNTHNTLQVLTRGSTLFFYVNGTFLTTQTDTTFTTSGDIGFSADSATSIGNVVDTEVVFSNLKVSPQQ